MDFSLCRTIAQQGGVLTTAQARERYTEWEIRQLVAAGRWRRSGWRGVLVDAELPDPLVTSVRAAALDVGGDLVACHSTAARSHGSGVVPTQGLHFLGPAPVANRRRPGIQVHPSTLGTDDAVLVGGVWCTPAARTACDVVRLTPPIDGLATLDAALRSGSCTAAESSTAVRAQAGLREVTRLRALVPLADGRAESPMESRMRWQFVDGGLPVPEVQVRVGGDRAWREMDTGWRRKQVGAEFDGLQAHMTAEQLGADRHRHNWLTDHRWTLLHFTAGDVYRGSDAMVATAARALGLPSDRRSWRTGGTSPT